MRALCPEQFFHKDTETGQKQPCSKMSLAVASADMAEGGAARGRILHAK